MTSLSSYQNERIEGSRAVIEGREVAISNAVPLISILW